MTGGTPSIWQAVQAPVGVTTIEGKVGLLFSCGDGLLLSRSFIDWLCLL